MMKALFPLLLLAFGTAANGQLGLVLPTENTALLEKRPESYFQFVDRTFEGEKTTPWEGGQFGFVRDPRRVGNRILFARFHEGMDVKPLQRDAKGDPLDVVCAIADGVVEYVTASPGLSNYGRYIVVRHDFRGAGPFYSLYAHLREARVMAGEPVKAGQGIGLMGYTGAGIDQRRAHLHVELNLLLSSKFEAWHSANFTTPNRHGLFNGINMIGLDLQSLFLAVRKEAGLSLPAFFASVQPGFRVRVPGGAEMEFLRSHPWLLTGAAKAGAGGGWEVTLSPWGLPLRVEQTVETVSAPALSWVRDTGVPHYHLTRGLVTGSGPSGQLTAEGLRFVKLLCGVE
jgi:murein DD-endopeptidase MepM/ murein hydrolase activator NlpD